MNALESACTSSTGKHMYDVHQRVVEMAGDGRTIQTPISWYCIYCLEVTKPEYLEDVSEVPLEPSGMSLAGVRQLVTAVGAFLESSDTIASMPRDVELPVIKEVKERQQLAKQAMAAIIGYPSK